MAKYQRIFQIFIICLAFWLFNHGDCLADVRTDTFDDYNTSATSSLKTLSPTYWATSTSNCLIQTSNYNSSPQGFYLNGVSSQGCHYDLNATSSTITSFGLYIYIPEIIAGNQNFIRLYTDEYNPASPNDNILADIYLEYDYSTYGDVMLRNENTSESANLVGHASLTTGWHYLSLKLVNNKLYGAWDTFTIVGGDDESASITVDTTDGTNWTSFSIYRPIVGTNQMILKYDDLYIEDTVFDINDVEIIDLPDWNGIITIETEEILQFDSPKYCTIGYTCRLGVGYNPSAVGGTLYLYDYTGQTVLTSQELYDLQLKKDYLNIPTQISIQSINYKVVLETDATTTAYELEVVWQNEPTFLMDFFAQYNCQTICDDVATSTGIFDEFRYGVECGSRKVACWALVPATSTVIDFGASVESLKTGFPFSVIRQITGLFDNDSYLTATTTAITLGNIVPGLNPVIASTTMMSAAYGTLWDDYIYPLMKYFFYACLVGWLLARFLQITQKSKEQQI